MSTDPIEQFSNLIESSFLRAEFIDTDKRSVEKMNDHELATWQSKYQKDSPQFIFAEQLWRYRLAQKSALFGAIIAIVAALIGAFVGYALKEPGHQPETKIEHNHSTTAPNQPSNAPQSQIHAN